MTVSYPAGEASIRASAHRTHPPAPTPPPPPRTRVILRPGEPRTPVSNDRPERVAGGAEGSEHGGLKTMMTHLHPPDRGVALTQPGTRRSHAVLSALAR